MGKITFDGFAKSGDVPPLQGAFVTGANLRSSSRTKSTTPPNREAGAKAAGRAPPSGVDPRTPPSCGWTYPLLDAEGVWYTSLLHQEQG